MKVMASQPDGATREEMRYHLNQDGGAPGGAPPPPPPRPPPPGGAPRPPVHRRLYRGPGSTSRTGGHGTRGGAGGVVSQLNLVGGVGSGMGDGSGSKEGDVRGAQGDHDTGHGGTGRGGGSSSRVVPGAVGGTPAHPTAKGPSGAGVRSRSRGRPLSRLVLGVGVVRVALVGALRAQVGVVGAVVAVGCQPALDVVVGGQELMLVGALPPMHICGLSFSFS